MTRVDEWADNSTAGVEVCRAIHWTECLNKNGEEELEQALDEHSYFDEMQIVHKVAVRVAALVNVGSMARGYKALQLQRTERQERRRNSHASGDS